MAEDEATIEEWGAMPRLLLVEDNPLHVRLVRSMLSEVWPGYENMIHLARLDDTIEFLEGNRVDCVLLDLGLPDAEGLETVHAVLDAAPDIPVVVLSAHDDEEAAVEAVREGAQDYLVKGTVGAEGLAKSIRFAIQRSRIPQVEEVVDFEGPSPAPDAGWIGLAVLDASGTMQLAEPAVAEMLGRGVEDLIGLELDLIANPGDMGDWVGALATARTQGIAAVEVRLRHGSGSDLRVRMQLTPLQGASGEHQAFLARYAPLGQEGTASSGGTYAVMSGWA